MTSKTSTAQNPRQQQKALADSALADPPKAELGYGLWSIKAHSPSQTDGLSHQNQLRSEWNDRDFAPDNTNESASGTPGVPVPDGVSETPI